MTQEDLGGTILIRRAVSYGARRIWTIIFREHTLILPSTTDVYSVMHVFIRVDVNIMKRISFFLVPVY